jgi:hypothetical protein
MQIEIREFEDRIEYGYWEGEKFKNHREDGPAIEWEDGYKAWYFYGKIHREDGPAIEWSNVMKYWYLENEKIEEEDFEKELKKYKLSKVCK